MAHWQQPSPPSRGMRLFVFAAGVIVLAAIVVSIVALLFTFLLTPTGT